MSKESKFNKVAFRNQVAKQLTINIEMYNRNAMKALSMMKINFIQTISKVEENKRLNEKL